MTEELIHFQWKYAHHQMKGLCTDSGDIVEVIDPGHHNHDSGPDFFNAKVKLGSTIWAGNVEIHVKASDWERHGHNTNPAYDSVVLHVVAINDGPTINSKGNRIATVTTGYPDKLEWEYLRLVGSNGWIPCDAKLKAIHEVELRVWLTSLCFERLQVKSDLVNEEVDSAKGSWEEAFYRSVARSFGLKVNGLPFHTLAKATPLRVLSRVRDNLMTIEAIMYGQAGMLADPNHDESQYYQALVKEYRFQQQKNSLDPIPVHLWKFMRLRPVAFPTIRLAQFAMLIHRSSGLLSKVLEAKDYAAISGLLRVGCSDYWNNHYRFGRESKEHIKTLGDDTIRVIILNSIVPFMFAYGCARSNQNLKDKAMELLERIKPEANSVVQGFAKLGVKADSALFSQALVQLKSQYCDSRKCLFCPVGVKILLKAK